MGRAKNKKANNPPVAAKAAPVPVPVQAPSAATTEPNQEESLDEETVIVASLQPYLTLLPALRGVNQATQRALHEALYAAGSTAAQALESYLKDKSVLLKQLENTDGSSEPSSESEQLRLLLNYVSVEMAADNLKKACSGPDGKIILRDSEDKILNEVAAAALSAFAYAASRRPSTKHVEYLMNPTASVDAPDDTGSQVSQTLSALTDSKLVPPSPLIASQLYHRCTNTSTGTNGSSVGNPFNLKPRKRSTAPRRPNEEEDEELLTEDEEDDLEDDVSDDMDEDSGPLTGLLDESRRTESPVDDFDNTDALLRFACTVGHVDIVKSLVKIRNSPEYFCTLKTSTLMEACCSGQVEIVRELLAYGANINAVSDSRNTPLIYASSAGKLNCVQELLKHANIEVDARNNSGHTALMESSSAGHLEIVKELLSRGANIYAVVENVDFKESSLSLASYRGHVEVVKCLIGNMQDCPEKVDELHTGLLEAAMDGHVEVARVLLDGGALVNLPTENFESPLTLACCGGHYELVKLLLDRNADIEEPNDENYSPLMEASREGHREVVELLLDRGAYVNSKIEEGIETPLSLAASGGYLEVVELLVSRGGNLLLGERSPLYEATQEGHLEVVDYIVKQLKKNEEQQAVLEDLNYALVCAAETNNMALVKFFLENGANKDAFSKDGRTSLMEAARQGHLSMVEFLLQHGVDINRISPNNDATALSLACLFGHADVTQYLLEHGANPEVSLKDSVSCIIEASRNGNTDCARIVLDYIGLKNNKKTSTEQQPLPPVSTVAEISSRPKIKPVSKLNKEAGTQNTASVQQPQPPQQQPLNQGQFNPVLPPALNGAIVKLQQSTEDARLNELLQQLPGDLVSAVLAATNTSALSAAADESMLAHFLQRSLIEPKRRDASWTNEELNAFKEMVRQKVRQVPASTQSPNAGFAHTIHPSSQPPNQYDFIMSNMASECPGCANGYPFLPNPPEATSNSLKRKGPTVKPRSGSSVSGECAGSFGSRQVNNVKQKLAETSELLRSKLDTIQLNNETEETLQELRKTQQQKQSNTQNNSVIQASMYLNRMAPNTTNTTLTSEQQQQILFYQQQEIHNLQNLQTAAGHHHVGSTVPHTGNCHQSHHGINAAQMNCLSQLANNRMVRRNSQQIAPNTNSFANNPSPQKRQNAAAQDAKLSNYVDLQTETNNDTALSIACVGGHAPLVALLIQRGASVEHRDKKGFSPLILAATGGHVDCCKLLLEANCQVDATSERTKDTALSLACSSGRKEVVELLLRFNANKEHRNVSDYTPLSLAASGGYVDIIQLLLDAGAEINSRTGSKLGISPLMLAAMNGHDQATLLLLQRGSDINAQIETNRNTALTLACFQGRTEVVRLLLEYGANYEHRAKTGLSPLMEAANGGFTEVGALLLKAGADPNSPPVPTSRDTALTISADKGHSSFVAMLIEEGAAIDVKNKKGCTPLLLACSNGHLDTVKILVQNHADPDAYDNRKTSPLFVAFRKGFIKAERLMRPKKTKNLADVVWAEFQRMSNSKEDAEALGIITKQVVSKVRVPYIRSMRRRRLLTDKFQVVEFMAQHVNQFPNDQECQKFCNNIMDPDLADRVKKCMEMIVNAKDKQAEQANKAAQSLLDQLAEEEALAESKKLSKKRLKEKKRAKKLAKKQQETAEEVAEATPEPIPEEEPVHVPEPRIVVRALPAEQSSKKSTIASKKKQRKGSKEVSPSQPKEDNPEPDTITMTETRVPAVHDLPTLITQENGSAIQPSGSHSKSNQRRQNRGRRSEQTGNNNSRVSIHPNTGIVSPLHSPNVAATKASNDESEWFSAGKKRANSRPGKESSTASAATATSSSSRDVYHDLIALMGENSQVMESWTLNEPGSKRRAFAISVSSGTVARIIGRAGQNINAIREATNAHIEVEKIATRREQATRQITVKGTHDAIRNAIHMIDLLIRENDTLVSDIVRRVMKASQESPVDPASVSSTVPAEKQMDKRNLTQQASSSNNAQGNLSTQNVSANVWQQKAAIRKMQQSSDDSATPSFPTDHHQVNPSFGAPSPPSSTLSGSTSASISPVSTHYLNAQINTSTTANMSQHDFVYASMVAAHGDKDLKRKAPGFERLINTGASGGQVPSMNAVGPGRREEVRSVPLSNTVPSNEKTAPFLSSMLNDAPQIATLNSFGDSSAVTSGLVSRLAVGSQRQINNNVASVQQQHQRQQRPLSEIWDNNTTSTSDKQQLSGFGGLFDSGVIDSKSAAALWLPQPKEDIPATILSTRDDHWLDTHSATSLFGSLGLGDYNSVSAASNVFTAPKPENAPGMIGPGLTRPHSSTDWTNSASAWSNNVSVPLVAQRQFQHQWTVSPTSSVTNSVMSPPKNSVPNWSSGPPTTLQNYHSSRPVIQPTTNQLTSGRHPPSESPVPSRISNAADWGGRMDVFSMIAAQVGDVAEKEKKQAQQQSGTANTSINNVYAAYNTPAQSLLMRNRASQNPTPPASSSFSSGVTWSGQPNMLNNNPSLYNKTFGVGQQPPQSNIHQVPQQQWNGGWNY